MVVVGCLEVLVVVDGCFVVGAVDGFVVDVVVGAAVGLEVVVGVVVGLVVVGAVVGLFVVVFVVGLLEEGPADALVFLSILSDIGDSLSFFLI